MLRFTLSLFLLRNFLIHLLLYFFPRKSSVGGLAFQVVCIADWCIGEAAKADADVKACVHVTVVALLSHSLQPVRYIVVEL